MYCVKCGVELGDSEKKCPLCGTTVFHPEMEPPKGDGPYPPEEHIHKEVSRSGALFVVTVLTVLPIVICLLCDWRINGGIVWSGYVTGALLMCYIVIVLPLWFRRGNPVIFVPVDFVALGVYLLYIDLATGGRWFLSFAFPVVGAAGIIVTAMVILLRYLHGGHLFVFGGALETSGESLITRETVWWLTPASLATSNMDGRLLGLRLVTILPNLPAGGRHHFRADAHHYRLLPPTAGITAEKVFPVSHKAAQCLKRAGGIL